MQQLRHIVARASAVLVLVAAWAVPGTAQTPTTVPPPGPSAAQAAANKAYVAKDYARAAEAFRAVVVAEPANGMAWYRLGVSLLMLGQLDEAQRDLGVALERGFHPFSVHYRLAQIALERGDPATANAELEKGVATQPTPPESLTGDDALAPLRATPAFVALVEKQKRAFHPCSFDAAYHALDFWIGDWVVRDGAGNELGHSRIEPAVDGCAIAESWSGSLGGFGKSLSIYDVTDKRWYQHYVDTFGAHTNYVGGPQGKSIVMIAPGRSPAGAPMQIRMGFTPLDDGRVRQHIETSPDGTAWKTVFDGYYAKTAAPPKP